MPMRGYPRVSVRSGAAAPTGTALVEGSATTAVPAPSVAPTGSATAASRPERDSLTVSGIDALLSEKPSECDCRFSTPRPAGASPSADNRQLLTVVYCLPSV